MIWRIAALLMCCASIARAETVTVFAAASLKNALDEIAETFGPEMVVSYAGSSVLARQVAAGAAADVVMLANTTWMDWLVDQDAVVGSSRRDIVGNKLVLVAHAEVEQRPFGSTLVDALPKTKVAVAFVDAVPAGIYARQALEALGIWSAWKPNLVQTDNVRAALALVALGEAGFGLVYASDAMVEPRVSMVQEIDENLHDPIRYLAAVTPGANDAAQELVDMLLDAQAQAIFEAQGFTLLAK